MSEQLRPVDHVGGLGLSLKDESSLLAAWWRFNPDCTLANLFCHAWDSGHSQYPGGVAGVAGRWAKNRVPGDMVLFDCADEARITATGSDATYLQLDHDEVTYRIRLLTDAQKKALLELLLLVRPALLH